MDVGLFLEGVIIGFAIAAPVGPIGVLCIRRTLADGRASGFVSGLGAATADAVYGAIAAFGLTLIMDFLLGGASWLRLVGGAFLLYLGVKTFLARPAERAAERAAEARGGGLLGAYASTFFLTLTNPTTILSFAAIFAGLGVAGADNALSAALLVLGVFLGSAAWWLILSGGTDLFRSKLSAGGLQWVNRVSGTVIAAFGVLALSGLGR